MIQLASLLMLAVFSSTALAQSNYAEQLTAFRETYKQRLLAQAATGGPIRSANELTHLHFYLPDTTYRVVATLQRTLDAEPFDMPTYDGKQVPHVAYGVLTFTINGTKQTLVVYRNLAVSRLPQYRDQLFLPFKDATSGEETYGGGRYLDVRTSRNQPNSLVLDFNRAYNPYCAYREGYTCPIPPKDNRVSVPIRAGEKTYDGHH